MNHSRLVRRRWKGLDASTICVWWRSRVDLSGPPGALVETEVHSKSKEYTACLDWWLATYRPLHHYVKGDKDSI